MPNVQEIQGRCTTRDGHALHFLARVPAAPRAALLVVHGLAEHSGRYTHLMSRFAEAGHAVYALDHRGHGQSPGRRVHIRAFSDYLDDVDALRGIAAERHPGLPVILVGHSQGGLVVLTYALERPRGLKGAIVSSPALGVHPRTKAPAHLAAAARLLSVLWPSLLFTHRIDARHLSHDPQVVEAYQRDPLVTCHVSPRWFMSITNAMKTAHRRAPELTVPLLLMVSGQDVVVDPAAAEAFARRAPVPLVELVRWDGLYHEMFNEPERERVFACMDQWLARILDT